MTATALTILIVVFFVASAIGVVTGSNSLITVPVMFQLGIEPKTAVATNMFGLVFLNIGASIPFIREGKIDIRRVWPLAAITVAASAAGAALVGWFTSEAIPVIVTVAMILVALFVLFGPGGRKASDLEKGAHGKNTMLTFLLTFLLGIYGGLYSGGYVTILTIVLVAFAGYGYSQAIAATKFINVFSSAIATVVFAYYGLIDYSLGIILALVMFCAAFAGAKFAVKLSETWLRRIFLTAVLVLAVKNAVDFVL